MRKEVFVLGKNEDGPLKKTQVCESCHGSGYAQVSCNNCYVSWTKVTKRRKTPRSECTVCDGTGRKASSRKCGGCRGHGTINGPR